MPFTRGTIFRILPVLTLSFAALSAPAQSGNAGSIRGTVTDPSGAVIPGASIVALTTSGKVAGKATSDGGGSVSISGLAFRRLVIRPKWLGPVSYESGFIALLIFVLMATYLATFLPGAGLLDERAFGFYLCNGRDILNAFEKCQYLLVIRADLCGKHSLPGRGHEYPLAASRRIGCCRARSAPPRRHRPADRLIQRPSPCD